MLIWSLRMKAMFVGQADGELTQVDFWTLYKDAFTPFQDRQPLLVASDVIKNVNVVFPQAQAMVLPGPPQKFIVRGVDRLMEKVPSERFKCRWDRSQCPQAPFDSPGELYEHVVQHLASLDSPKVSCLWSTCPAHSRPKYALQVHILTHFSTTQPPSKHPSQSDTITLPSETFPYPNEDPTKRPPPPQQNTTITYRKPVVDPPTSSLTALLCIRILFRASFASSDVAPRVDADHFGFPGVVEDTDDQEQDEIGDGGPMDNEKEGERRGRKAFVGVQRLMEGVRMQDEILMGWITEMVNAG
jgi:chromatin structure-remodeling complex subunit RSC9